MKYAATPVSSGSRAEVMGSPSRGSFWSVEMMRSWPPSRLTSSRILNRERWIVCVADPRPKRERVRVPVRGIPAGQHKGYASMVSIVFITHFLWTRIFAQPPSCLGPGADHLISYDVLCAFVEVCILVRVSILFPYHPEDRECHNPLCSPDNRSPPTLPSGHRNNSCWHLRGFRS